MLYQVSLRRIEQEHAFRKLRLLNSLTYEAWRLLDDNLSHTSKLYEGLRWERGRAYSHAYDLNTHCYVHNYQPNADGEYICTRCFGHSVLAKMRLS